MPTIRGAILLLLAVIVVPTLVGLALYGAAAVTVFLLSDTALLILAEAVIALVLFFSNGDQLSSGFSSGNIALTQTLNFNAEATVIPVPAALTLFASR